MLCLRGGGLSVMGKRGIVVIKRDVNEAHIGFSRDGFG